MRGSGKTWTERQRLFSDTSVVRFESATMKSLFRYKHSSTSTNTVHLALAEQLQVGGFSFGSEDLSF